jgi:hypothetical protein
LPAPPVASTVTRARKVSTRPVLDVEHVGAQAVLAREGDAELDEPRDPLRPLLGADPHDRLVVEAVSGGHGVARVRVEGVLGVEDRRDAPLSPGGVGVVAAALGDDGDLAPLGHLQGVGEARDTAAQNQRVEGVSHGGRA